MDIYNKDTQFKCAQCGGIYDKEWSDEIALAESKAIFGDYPLEDLAIVCDDCFNQVKHIYSNSFYLAGFQCSPSN